MIILKKPNKKEIVIGQLDYWPFYAPQDYFGGSCASVDMKKEKHDWALKVLNEFADVQEFLKKKFEKVNPP